MIADKYPTGVNIVDSADNIKTLITSTDSAVIPAKDYIKGISSNTDANEKIQLTWDQYLGALSGSNFDKTNTSTWSTLTSEIAFQNLGTIELVVSGKASEIQSIIDRYGSSLTNFSAGLTLISLMEEKSP